MRVLSTPSTLRRRAVPWLATLLLMACATLAHAQSSDDAGAPPDRVARLSYVSGDLGLLPAGATDWGDANLNRPLTTGDKLSIGNGARAELELGGGTLRMAGNTDFGMLNLSDQIAQVELTRGTLNLNVRRLDQGQSYEIDTPTLALVVTQPGNFRVDVGTDGNGTQVTVFDGQATVYGENNAQRNVLAGRRYQFEDSSLGALMITDIQDEDGFDAWCDERTQRYARASSRRYVSEDMVGAQDLDRYGRWQTTTEYGAVWYPQGMPVGWAPYRYGHWAWIAPWGWTWVDDSPWGFAPYHYGRWAVIGGAWGWVPGPIVVRPVYAPALVAFVGGGGWSIGIGAAPVGWFPLGPGEIYNPWYHVDRGYYQRVNITNIYVHNTYNRTVIVNNINRQYDDYRNGRLPPNHRYLNHGDERGFSAMPGNAFASGQRVQRDQMRIDPRQLGKAPVLAHGVTAVRPTLASFTPERRAQARPLPTADFHRNVVARTPPPAALATTRAPFAPTAVRPEAAPAPRPFTNVRVLNGRHDGREAFTGADASARPVGTMPRQAVEPGRRAAAEAAVGAGAGAAAAAASRAPDIRTPREAAMPPAADALPSSRFAHPEGLPRVAPGRRADAATAEAGRPGNAERPTGMATDRAPAPTRLPQEPRFDRAAPQGQADAPARYPRAPRADMPREAAPDQQLMRAPRQPSFRPSREAAPPEPAMPSYQPPVKNTQMEYQTPHDPQPQNAEPRFQQPPQNAMPREQMPRFRQPQNTEPRFRQPPQEAMPREEMPRFQPPPQNAMPHYEAPRFPQPQYAPPRQEAPRPAAQPQRSAAPAPRKVNPKHDEQQN